MYQASRDNFVVLLFNAQLIELVAHRGDDVLNGDGPAAVAQGCRAQL